MLTTTAWIVVVVWTQCHVTDKPETSFYYNNNKRDAGGRVDMTIRDSGSLVLFFFSKFDKLNFGN